MTKYAYNPADDSIVSAFYNGVKYSIGDEIIYRGAIDSYSGRRYYNINNGEVFRIEEIREGSMCPLVRLWMVKRDASFGSSYFKLANFSFHRESEKMAENTVELTHIVHNSKNQQVAVRPTDSAISVEEIVAQLLRKNPTEVFRVFKLEMIGSLPAVPVQWNKAEV